MAGNLLIKYAAAASSKARKHNGFSSTVTTSFALTTSQPGLVWAGTDILYGIWGSPYATAYIKRGTGFSSTVKDSFTIDGATLVDMMDWDWDGINLMFSRGGSTAAPRKHWLTTGFSSTIQASFSYAYYSRGICWDGTHAIIIGGDVVDHCTIKKYSGFGGSIIDSLHTTSYNGGYGVTWDGSNLMFADNASKFRKTTGFSLTISDSFAYYDIMGMDWDGFPSIIKKIAGINWS